MGGAALPLYHAGLDYVAVEGRSEAYLIAAIKGSEDGALETRFEELREQDINALFKGYAGTRADGMHSSSIPMNSSMTCFSMVTGIWISGYSP